MAGQEFTTEIAVVGGGMTGGLAALALSQHDFDVCLIEGSTLKSMTSAKYDGRTTAIAYASMRVLRRLGLWDDIKPAAEPILDILVTDGQERTRFRNGQRSAHLLHFDSRDLAQDGQEDQPLGWIVENSALRAAIFKRLKDTPNVRLLFNAHRVASGPGPGNCETELADGRKIHAKLRIAADGKQSALRGEAGIRVNHWQYGQKGIVATVSHEKPHGGFAQEFFLPGGPFAILPLTSIKQRGKTIHRSNLVWTEKKAAVDGLLALQADALTHQMRARFGRYLGDVEIIGRVWSYPLSFHLAHRFTAPRLALIGDAARAIHPIAGQGYNLAIKDVAALVDVLNDSQALGLDIGHLSVLRRFEQWRRFDSVSLALGTDMLNRLFSNDYHIVRQMRDAGLGLVNRIAPARRFFMRQAGADLGTLPSLMRAL